MYVLNSFVVYVSVAEIFSAMNESVKAIEMCNRAVDVDPYYIAGYYELGFLYAMRLEDNENGIFYFDLAIEVSKKIKFLRDTKLVSGSYRIRSKLYFDKGEGFFGMNDLEMSLYYSPCILLNN
jgi:tetratricopeptide (TPR) repeat protein